MLGTRYRACSVRDSRWSGGICEALYGASVYWSTSPLLSVIGSYTESDLSYYIYTCSDIPFDLRKRRISPAHSPFVGLRPHASTTQPGVLGRTRSTEIVVFPGQNRYMRMHAISGIRIRAGQGTFGAELGMGLSWGSWGPGNRTLGQVSGITECRSGAISACDTDINASSGRFSLRWDLTRPLQGGVRGSVRSRGDYGIVTGRSQDEMSAGETPGQACVM